MEMVMQMQRDQRAWLLGTLYRRFYTHSNSDALFHLYQSLVCPTWSMQVQYGARTELERLRHLRMFKNLPSVSVERPGIKAIDHF